MVETPVVGFVPVVVELVVGLEVTVTVTVVGPDVEVVGPVVEVVPVVDVTVIVVVVPVVEVPVVEVPVVVVPVVVPVVGSAMVVALVACVICGGVMTLGSQHVCDLQPTGLPTDLG